MALSRAIRPRPTLAPSIFIIGVAPAGMDRLSSVDSAVSDGAGNVQVIVTSRDGNVWATSRACAGAYTPLARVAALPL